MLYYAAISLTILSSIAYHTLLKLTPVDAHPALALVVTYATSTVAAAGLLFLMPLKTSIAEGFKRLNWGSYVLGLALVGLEMGFLLSYRAGWRAGIAGIVVTVAGAMLLIPIGMALFKEKPSLLNLAGIGVAVVGLIMMNAK